MSGCPFEGLSKGWEGLRSKAWAGGRSSEETLQGTLPGDPSKSKGYKVVLAKCKELPDRAGKIITEKDQEGLKLEGQEGGASRRKREERTGCNSSRDC